MPLRPIEKAILDFVALATPINDNPVAAVRPASAEAINGFVRQLDAVKVVDQVHGRDLGISRNSLRHTPWRDREMRRKN